VAFVLESLLRVLKKSKQVSEIIIKGMGGELSLRVEGFSWGLGDWGKILGGREKFS